MTNLERVKELELLAWLTSYYFVFSDLSKSRKDLREPENQRKWLLLREPFVYSPFADSHESIQSFQRAGLFELVSHELPACVSHNSETYFISWAGVPLRSLGISIGSKPFLYSKKAFRAFNNFAGIYPFQLSEGLAIVELDRKIRDYVNGFYSPRKNETLDTMAQEIAEEYFKIEKLRKSRN